MWFFDLIISIIQTIFVVNVALICLKPNKKEKKYIYLIVIMIVAVEGIIFLYPQFKVYSF